MPTKHVFVEGKVQGVFFRDTTRRKANELGVRGWVRNLPDGRVEATFQGPRKALEEIVEFCHEGPPRASVDQVQAEDVEEPEDTFEGFEVRATPDR